MIELLVVLSIVLILSAVSLFYLTGHQKLYRPDDQSILISDILQEARQRSLTERKTMRVEVNLTRNTVRLIDENGIATANDDVILKTLQLFEVSDVVVGANPANIGLNPPEPLPAPTAVFRPSVYPTSITNRVCTLRFRTTGEVVDEGDDAIGTNARPNGLTLHVWSPKKNTPAESDIARSITVIGSTGMIRLWEFDASLASINKWKDSRRAGTY